MQTDLQKTVFYTTYSRWNDALQRRETWEETTNRVIGYLKGVGNSHPAIEWDALYNGMLNMEVLPSMRVVQMAGPTLDRCNVGAYNCAYLPLKDWRCFSELMYILMQGTGVGFSVEDKYISQLPVIKPQTGENTIYLQISDSTEGWCNALADGLTYWSAGHEVEFDYSAIRPYGSPLKTKGGKASGPEPLRNLLDFARKLLLAHQGRRLSSLNCHDLACYAGSIVQVGGVRRAAEISLSDLNDTKLRAAKTGRFYELYPERMMANNSAVYNEEPNGTDFIDEWIALAKSGTGERGIFNRGGIAHQIPARRRFDPDFGINPCGEIILRPFEFCNLSVVVARPEDQMHTLERKAQLATQFGIVQSLLTKFNYIREDWKRNCEEERLLGVDITGQMDNGLFLTGNGGKSLYATLKDTVLETSVRLADALGINIPTATTCVKPSGNSSQLLGVSSGIHPRYSRYYIRRLRINASNPVSQMLRAAGVPHHAEIGQDPLAPQTWVFEFPVASPKWAVTRDQCTAIDQLNQWLTCKTHYTEHNPSCTVYVKDDEWLAVGGWVQKNWNSIGGLSFLPFDGGVYTLAPYEAISETEYLKRQQSWPVIDFDRLLEFEHSDTTELNREFACSGDKCEI